jgi:hypothetical protein
MPTRPTTTAAAALLLPLLMAAPAAAQDRVGVTSAVNQDAELERSGGRRTVVIGENVLFQDRVITSRDALVQILFVDGSAFTVGANARVVIDEFVFDPATGSGDLVAEVTEGALRFVGGRLSKSGGQVRLKTPVGTLGVRGAIATVDLSPPCTGGVCPIATASLVFGREMALAAADGRPRRIHKAGYSFVFTGDPRNPSVDIVPTSTLDQSSLQARLSGKPGKTGGAVVIPTDANVVASGLPRINSNRAPRVVLPRPRPHIIRTAYTPSEDEVGIGSVTNTIQQTIVNQAGAELVNQTIGEGPTPPPPPGDTAPMAVYVTPDTYTDGTVTVTAPGRVDIVSDVSTLFDVKLVFDKAGNPVEVRGEQDVIAVPESLGRTPIDRFFSPTVQEFALGSVYRGEEDFLFYYFQRDLPDAAATQVAYLVYGRPTDPAVILPAEGLKPQEIRSYALLGDEQKRARGIATELALLNPLVAEAFGVGALQRAAETPFFIVDKAENQRLALTGYAGLLIDGTGAEQKSAVNLALGTFERNASGRGEITGSREGSYRVDAGLGAATMRGVTESLNALPGGSDLFGSEGQNFVLTSGARRNSPFRDDQPASGGILRPGETLSSTMIVANLVGAELASNLDRPRSFLTGYAAGMVEPRSGAAPRPFRSDAVGDMVMRFDPVASRLGGVIEVRDVTGADPVVDRLVLQYGSASRDDPTFSRARSVYVDRDTYFARAAGVANSPESPGTQLVLDDGTTLTHRPDRQPGTYLVGSETVPQPALFADAGVTPCACKFMEWGWWGTATDFEGEGLPGGRRRDAAHLGTWAAGEVTRTIELPRTGTASYEGHAVGNVVNGGAQYVAAGSLAVDYDFGARTGQLTISNFDGRTFSGGVTGAASGPAGFRGGLSGSGLTGSATGSFMTGPAGPAQGVLGAFDVGGRGYSAVGTFMGERSVGR